MTKGRIRKWLLTAAGTLAFGVGLLGVFIPLLPTTRILLLAAGCWMRSSERLHDWLLHHAWFGDYVRNYVEHRAVHPRARAVPLVLLWVVIGATAFLAVGSWWVRTLLGMVALGVTLHLLQLKSLRPDMQPPNQRCLEGNDVYGTWLAKDSERLQEAHRNQRRSTNPLASFAEDASVGYADNALSDTNNVSLLASNAS